jgi:hypothetical protein
MAGNVMIVCEDYEYESFDELSSKYGPSVPNLKLSGKTDRASVSIDMSYRWSSYIVENTDDESILNNTFAEFDDFFRRRVSVEPYLRTLGLLLFFPAVTTAFIFAVNYFIPEPLTGAIRIIGFIVFVLLLMLSAASIMGLIMYVPGGGTVELRNYSKRDAQFSEYARRLDNREKIKIGVIVAIFTALVTYFASVLFGRTL